ncbi:MAG: phage integrase N-terminal SAM-like domain-containing protein [Pseudomonadota bacterium]
MGNSPFLYFIADYMTVRRYSRRTIRSYVRWIKSYIIFHNKRHPKNMGTREVIEYLTYLATERNVSAGTQSLALNAIAFLYNKFLDDPIGDLGEFRRASRQAKLPSVLTIDEIERLLRSMQSKYRLMACIIDRYLFPA